MDIKVFGKKRMKGWIRWGGLLGVGVCLLVQLGCVKTKPLPPVPVTSPLPEVSAVPTASPSPSRTPPVVAPAPAIDHHDQHVEEVKTERHPAELASEEEEEEDEDDTSEDDSADALPPVKESNEMTVAERLPAKEVAAEVVPAKDESVEVQDSMVTPPSNLRLIEMPTFEPVLFPVFIESNSNNQTINEDEDTNDDKKIDDTPPPSDRIVFTPMFSFLTINGYSSNGSGVLVSNLNYGGDFSWQQYWSEEFHSFIKFGFQEVQIEQSLDRTVDNASQLLARFSIGGEYRFPLRLSLGAGIGAQNQIFYHSESVSEISVDKAVVPAANIWGKWNFFSKGTLSANVTLQFGLLLPTSTGFYDVNSGNSYLGAINIVREVRSQRLWLEGNLFYGKSYQSSSALNFTTSEVGTQFGVSLAIDPPAVPADAQTQGAQQVQGQQPQGVQSTNPKIVQ